MDKKELSAVAGVREDGPQAVEGSFSGFGGYEEKGREDFSGLMAQRVWVIPALLLFFLLVPLWREGLPATQMGLLPLYPEVAKSLVGESALNFWIIPLGYKLSVALFMIMLTGGVGLLAHQLWGRVVAWWVAALWVVLPLTISLTYQVGWFYYINGMAALFFGLFIALSAEKASRWYWLVALYLLFVGLSGFWVWEAALDPYQLLLSTWPPSENLRIWLASSSYEVGLVPVVLGVLAALVAWPRRQEMAAKKVLFLLGIALISLLLALFDAPTRLYLALATLALLLAAGGLPVLDKRYASFSVLLAILAIAALSVYPYLQTGWIATSDYDLPSQATAWRFGDNTFWLVDVQHQQVGAKSTVIMLWQVTARPERDYSVFVHLLNEQGEIVSQADSLLLDQEEIPTSSWPVGYIVRQKYETDSAELATQLRFGLYHAQTLERLPVDGSGDNVTIPIQ